MSLPPLPRAQRARPALVVLGLVSAIVALQLIGIVESVLGLTIGYRAVPAQLFTIILVLLLAVYHFSRRRRGIVLARSELRYRTLAKESTDLVVVINAGVSPPYVSPGLTTLLGYDASQASRIAVDVLVDPEDLATAMDSLASLSRAKPRDRLTLRLRQKGGSLIWVEARLCWIEQSDGVAETVITMQDVTQRLCEAEELREATLLAKRAQAEADRANAAKTEFLAQMSHEIRTPLNSVIGFAGLLLRLPELQATVRLYVERIHGGGNALLTVVNDILDFSQVEAGRLELSNQPFSLASVIDECVSLIQPAASAKHLSIHVAIGERLPPSILGDAARLRQILLNLLNNAVKFTREGSVLLDIRQDRGGGASDRLRFAIIDTGIGIAETDMPRLFQRFEQIDASIQRTYGGTGLGLAISRRLVELMGGEIGVTSERGVGSTFWFSVPLPHAALVKAADRGGDEDERKTEARTIRILLVDDVPINQDLVLTVLESAHHSVDVVGNGAEAIMAVQDLDYDMVLMDIQMPYVDGIAATRIIRALPHKCRDVPIVAMTANVLPAQTATAIAAGMVDVLHKPFSAAQIHDLLARVVGSNANGSGEVPASPEDSLPSDFDGAVLAKLASLIGDAKVKSLLTGLVSSLRDRFDGDPLTKGGRDALKRHAHASVAGSGMLGFTGFAAACKTFETTTDADGFPVRTVDLRAAAASVIERAAALAAAEAPLSSLTAAA